jgi:hypothetical protein
MIYQYASVVSGAFSCFTQETASSTQYLAPCGGTKRIRHGFQSVKAKKLPKPQLKRAGSFFICYYSKMSNRDE